MARPLKDINWDIVLKKMEAGCSAKEIYGGFDISICRDTFYDRFKDQFGCSFSDYSARYTAHGEGNLRVTQYVKALGGDSRLLVHLGKYRLGQNDEAQVKTLSPLQSTIDKDHYIMTLENRLAELEANANKPEAE